MGIIFLDSQSSLHYEFVLRGQILNHELCLTLLRRQQEQCETNDRTLTEHSWFCHHENAFARTALFIQNIRRTKLHWFHSHPTTLISLK